MHDLQQWHLNTCHVDEPIPDKDVEITNPKSELMLTVGCQACKSMSSWFASRCMSRSWKVKHIALTPITMTLSSCSAIFHGRCKLKPPFGKGEPGAGVVLEVAEGSWASDPLMDPSELVLPASDLQTTPGPQHLPWKTPMLPCNLLACEHVGNFVQFASTPTFNKSLDGFQDRQLAELCAFHSED